jgi:hypothetical protein
MNRALFLGSIALAFAAGCGATRLLPQAAIAADTMMTAQILHVPDLKGDALGSLRDRASAPRRSSWPTA